MIDPAKPAAPSVIRQIGRVHADPSRVIATVFVPGHALAGRPEGRASGVVKRLMALTENEVAEAMDSVVERFAGRHQDLEAILHTHATRIRNRLAPDTALSNERWLLLGATFTQEYALEGAAICNPSVAASPDQRAVPDGALRFVMTVRQIGEGHHSTIGLRTGIVDDTGQVTLDQLAPTACRGLLRSATLDHRRFQVLAHRSDDDTEATAWVLDRLSEHFTHEELDARLVQLEAQADTRRNAEATARRLRDLAERFYSVHFEGRTELTARTLHPEIGIESVGMEDARLVRFVDDDDTVTYHATYTAFDGRSAHQQLLSTEDFTSFSVSPLLGAAAADKGMALFPRRVGGRFVALSRHDGASSSVAYADDLGDWPHSVPLATSNASWDLVQGGNCGPPIETASGWLVLTHGVGPMRTYSIGACLLDLDDPTVVLGSLPQPLLSPDATEQDGYVPNVVYSCGSLVHNGHLLIPYGVGDASIAFASTKIDDLISAMHPTPLRSASARVSDVRR